MNPERTSAYRRVLDMIAELGSSKLQDAEQDRIRYVADSLIFCDNLSADEGARQGLVEIQLMLDTLVQSGRWEQATADRLAADLLSCGPAPGSVELRAA
jgi:hypothetical protein